MHLPARLILIALVLYCLMACTSTHVKTERWELRRVSFLQNVSAPSFTIAADGSANLTGYNNDGGNAAIAALAEAIKSIK